MNTVIYTNKTDTDWGKNTKINEIEKVISANKKNLSDIEIRSMLGEEDKKSRENGNNQE